MMTKKQIIIIRHGKPKIQKSYKLWTLFNIYELKKVRASYDAAEIDKKFKPPQKLLKTIKKTQVAYSSGYKRSKDSLQMLGFDNYIEEKKLLNEIEPKFGNFFNIKLPLCLWYLIFTILWVIGNSNDGESKRDSEIRAKKAALLLQKNAIENGSILYVGHRAINRLIGNELKKLGWTFSQKFKTCYWGDNIFYLEKN